jgi:hypothetical protein
VTDREAKNPLTDPPAQTKFLIVGLEAAQKPLFKKQETKSKDFTKVSSSPGFASARMNVGADESSSSDEEDKKNTSHWDNLDSNMIDDDM